MNANELADALQETEPYYSTDYKLFDKAANMLRQQQAEIEEWKRKYKDMHNLATQAMSRVHELEKQLALYKPEDDDSKTVCHACDGTGLCDRA